MRPFTFLDLLNGLGQQNYLRARGMVIWLDRFLLRRGVSFFPFSCHSPPSGFQESFLKRATVYINLMNDMCKWGDFAMDPTADFFLCKSFFGMLQYFRNSVSHRSHLIFGSRAALLKKLAACGFL